MSTSNNEQVEVEGGREEGRRRKVAGREILVRHITSLISKQPVRLSSLPKCLCL